MLRRQQDAAVVWRYKDAEPTEIALRVNVGLGMAAALAGLVLVVLSF